MSALEKKALEVAANASLSKSMSYRIYENGKALAELTGKHGVILHDTPADYFPAYMAAAKKSLETNAAKNKFFAKVWQSQKDFADIAVPFWSGAQMSNAKLRIRHLSSRPEWYCDISKVFLRLPYFSKELILCSISL